MQQVRRHAFVVILLAVAPLSVACSALTGEVTEYNINMGMEPGTEALFVSVQEMKDSILLIGTDSPEIEPAPAEIDDFLHGEASSSGWRQYQLLMSHLVTRLGDYNNYFILAEYEKDGQQYMHAGIVGIYVSGEQTGTIDYRADTYSPGLTSITYHDRPVQTGDLFHPVKYTAGGNYRIMFGVVTDRRVDSVQLGVVYGPYLNHPERPPLGEFSWELDAGEYPCFLLVLTETHTTRGEKPVRGFPNGHIMLKNWTALDEEGDVVGTWSDPYWSQ